MSTFFQFIYLYVYLCVSLLQLATGNHNLRLYNFQCNEINYDKLPKDLDQSLFWFFSLLLVH